MEREVIVRSSCSSSSSNRFTNDENEDVNKRK